MIGNAFRIRKIRRIADSTICSVCGKPLGSAACKLADETARQARAEYLKKNPGVRLRVVELVQAICTSCGTQYRFDRSTQKFVVRGESPVNKNRAGAG